MEQKEEGSVKESGPIVGLHGWGSTRDSHCTKVHCSREGRWTSSQLCFDWGFVFMCSMLCHAYQLITSLIGCRHPCKTHTPGLP